MIGILILILGIISAPAQTDTKQDRINSVLTRIYNSDGMDIDAMNEAYDLGISETTIDNLWERD
jgi:hypothetical protein